MSVLSSSSFGSSLNSGTNALHVPGKEREGGNMDEEEDEDALDEQNTSFWTGIFGVIYTVSRERTVTWKFVTFKLFMDCWQLLMLVINPAYGWKIDGSQKWWKVISIVQLTDFMANRGLTFFLGVLYIFVFLLLGTLGVCLWVAWSFKNKRFNHVWPITLLRWFGVIFFQILDVASMSFFLITLDCQYFDVDPAVMFYNQEFPQEYCWKMPYLINVIVATMSLMLFVVLSALFQMGEMELALTTRNPLGMAHSMVEVQCFLIKFLMASASTFLNNLKWLSTFYTVCSLMLVYLAVQHNPYYNSTINYIRAGINGAVLYCSGCMMLLVFKPSVDPDDLAAVNHWEQAMTIAMVAGLVPAACLAALGSHLRLRFYLFTVVNRFRNAKPGTKSHFIHEFDDPLEVAVASRCCRKWVDKDTLDEEAVATAGAILKAGMLQLPGNAFMCILYSSYLIEVQGSYQSGLAELKAARKADPSFLERFAIFSREQQHMQKASAARGTGAKGADLVSYVEQQRDVRLAIKVHKEALRVTGVFWRCLVHPVVKLETLAQAVGDFDAACRAADRTYRSVILRNPENWKLIRMYATFVEFIKNDPWTAAKWSAEADRLFQEEDDEKHNAVLTDAADGDNAEGQTSMAIRAAMEDGNRGVIIINAQGFMTAVNKTTCDVLGYAKKQLLGKNISLLIPMPYSKAHDSYIANYVRSGHSKMLNNNSYLLMLHQDRTALPIALHATRISGVGMDSVFMGIFEPIPPPPDKACVWLMPAGNILSVDPTFSDWFGYQNRDVGPSVYMTSLFTEPKIISEALKTCQAKAKEDPLKPVDRTLTVFTEHLKSNTGNDDLLLEGVQIKHKYAGPMSCSLRIASKGTGLRHMFEVLIARPPQLHGMIVSDRRGKLCHVSTDLAEALGYPVPVLLGDMAHNAWDFLLPEPFCLLHRIFVTQDLPGTVPPFSCRSGLSMCLMTSSAGGTEPQPFSMTVKPRKMESGDTFNIVHLAKTTMEKALDERRLSILIDENGIIVKVGDSSDKLFGYDPKRMLGMPISAFVDVFALNSESSADNISSASTYTQDILVELAIRSLSAPGSSFRVGVSAPADVHVGQLTGGGRKTRRASLLGDAIAAHILTQGQHPAVMQVKLHMESQQDNDSFRRSVTRGQSVAGRHVAISHQKSQQLIESIRKRALEASQSTVKEPAGLLASELESLEREDSIPMPVKAPTPPVTLASGMSFAVPSQGSGSGLMLEVELWRADLMTGVLQLDTQGCVSSTYNIPLFQPGLILGVDSASLVGAHVSDLLPPMQHRPLDDLLLPDLGMGPQGAMVKRGGLKAQKKNGGERERKPGPPNRMTMLHMADGTALELSVQAVPSTVQKKSLYLIVRAVNPSTGMPGFREWLKSNPVAGAAHHGLSDSVATATLTKAASQHSSSGDGTPAVTAHLALQQQHLPPHLRLSARGMPMQAVSGSKRRSNSVTIMLPAPGTEGAPNASFMLRNPRDSAIDQGRAHSPPLAAEGASLIDPDEDHAYAIIDKALMELQQQAAARASPSKVDEGAATAAGAPNVPSEIVEPKAPMLNKAGTSRRDSARRNSAPIAMPDRTHAWVLTDGSVAGSDLRMHSTAATHGVRASLSGSEDHHSVASGDSDKPVVPIKSAAVHASGSFSDLVVAEAIGALGGVRQSPSENGSITDDHKAGDKAGDQGSDYKRGQRFKRIARLLTGEAAKRNLRTFRLQAWGAAMFVLLVTLLCFIIMLILLNKQQSGVLILNTIGLIGVEVGHVFNAMVKCDILISGQYVQGLPGLQSGKDLQPKCIDNSATHSALLKELLSSAFFSIMQLADGNGLHALWNQPTVAATVFTDSFLPGLVNSSNTYMSIFDIGNLYAEASAMMAQNIVSYNASVPYWRLWSHPMNIYNSSGTLFIALDTSLDALLQIVISGAENLNTIQYMLMALEGCVCSILVVAFMFAVVTKISIERWNLYSVFMVIPVTLLKSLVKKTAQMEEMGHSDDTHPEKGETATGQEADEGVAVKLNVSSAASLKSTSMLSMLASIFTSLLFWRRRAVVSPVYTKRQLIRSHMTAVYLSSPFFLWGIMMVAINLSGHGKLAEVSGPIAIFNLVNMVTTDYYRAGALAKDMMQVAYAGQGDVAYITASRRRMNNRYDLPNEYSAMLFGVSGVAASLQGLPRYALAPTGVAFTGGEDIMYDTHACLRTDQSTCLGVNHTLYPVAHGGLDGMMQLFMKTVMDVRGLNDTILEQYAQNLPEFATIWNLEPDIEGGLVTLNAKFYDYVISVYNEVLTIHIVGLVLSILVMTFFLVCMLRPYVNQLANETKRIAELLSQLPSDVDVEGLIQRAQKIEKVPGAGSNSMDREVTSANLKGM